jgi:hypothetical protein
LARTDARDDRVAAKKPERRRATGVPRRSEATRRDVPDRPRATSRERRLPSLALAALGLALYGRGFTVGLVGDDYTLLDAALREPLLDLLSGRHGILGYYRPISRELYFYVLGHLAGGAALVYHVVNASVYAATLVLFHRLLERWQGARVATFATLLFLLFPAGGALLSWVSCAQDLIALLFGVAAFVLHQRGRYALAGLALALAVLSKETAVVMGSAIVLFDWASDKETPLRARLRRLAPAAIGLAVAIAIAVLARFTWPPGTSVAIWSPRQLTGAAALPLDFARTFWPPDTLAGVEKAGRERGWLIVLIAALGMLAVPSSAERRTAAGGRAILFGVGLAVLGMLPVGVILERWRGYFFSFAALGSSIAAGAALARVNPWVGRAIAAALAIVHFGANGIYQPVQSATGPARHPHVNYRFFRESADLTKQLLASLEPSCGAIAATPRVFTLGVGRDALFESVLGPALRVTCRDTVSNRLRPLEAMELADADRRFGLLRFDAATATFGFQVADPEVRASIGEGLLLSGHVDLAAALFTSAAREGLRDPVFEYRTAVTLAAAGRTAESRAWWAEARAAGRVPSAAALVSREVEGSGLAPPSTAALEASAAQALADPTDLAAHAAFGDELLRAGLARAAAVELSAAAGMGARGAPLLSLARAFDALGAKREAREAYERALAGGLDPSLFERARIRVEELDRELAMPGMR